MKTELSVIIVNYNGLKYLKNCLESLNQKLSGIAFEIIIIDNDSKDESCTFIKQNFPAIKLIESKINFGFGKGNNEAVKQALGEYLLLINNDTIVLDHLLPALNVLRKEKTVGVLGINMLNANKDYIPSAGNFPNLRNMFRFQKILDLGLEFQKGIFSKTYYEVDWLNGSFLLMPKSVFYEVKGFDEDYFMYVEDVDICKKIADKGYKRLFLPELSYIHFIGFNAKKNPMLVKGYRIYTKKHFVGLKKQLIFSVLLINAMVKNIKLMVSNN